MTREVKFRGWDRDYKSMTYQSPTVSAAKILDRYDIVMQFTGLHDKNGKEIYEGDILQCEYWLYGTGEVMRLCGEVIYDAPWWLVNWDYKWHDYESIEVIGNIRENPELLKE
jgi:hypothetical protein